MERAELGRLLGARAAAHASDRIIIDASSPQQFMAAFARAVAGTGEVFLFNPDWGRLERSQADEVLRAKPPQRTPSNGWLMIPTGGTGGKVRFARHDSATIASAVRGFARHFSLPQVNAAGVLPLFHVSGLMAWMRCVLTGGEYLPLNWKAIEGGEFPELPQKAEGWTISLVPTQLDRLLRLPRAVDWLGRFRIIFLGGAPAWPTLLDQVARKGLPLSPGYGMTESAAMIAALRPSEFVSGDRSSGTILPHARVEFDDSGAIVIGGTSLYRGYYPDWSDEKEFVTGDGGYLDSKGQLHVTGRLDAVIITGGEKVSPTEVESVLRGSGEFPDAVVFGVPDPEWGQLVVAAYPESARPRMTLVNAALSRLLAPSKRPKHFIPIAGWPANAQGKVNRAEVARLATTKLRS